MTARQEIDTHAYKNRSIHVDRNGIDNFLSTLKHPLYYLDYETIFPAIPLFDNSSPYQLDLFSVFLAYSAEKRWRTEAY
jgi:hypothetical protein